MPVVNESNRMIGNISVSDLRELHHSEFMKLQMPVGDFIRNMFQKAKGICRVDDTVDMIISLMLEERVHRLYVYENEWMVGVVTMSDILSLINLK